MKNDILKSVIAVDHCYEMAVGLRDVLRKIMDQLVHGADLICFGGVVLTRPDGNLPANVVWSVFPKSFKPQLFVVLSVQKRRNSDGNSNWKRGRKILNENRIQG